MRLKKLLLMINSQSFAMKIPWSWLAMKAHINKKYLGLFLLIFILFLPNGRLESLSDSSPPALNETFYRSLLSVCPKLLPTVFQDRTPQGEIEKTVFLTRIKEITSLNDCVEQCCRNETCKTVFAYKNSPEFVCYLGTCTEDENCLPVVPKSTTLEKLKGKALMVLVRTSDKYSSWASLNSSLKPDYPVRSTESPSSPSTTARTVTFSVKQSPLTETACEVGLELQKCDANEVCVPVQEKSRNGICQCQQGYKKSSAGHCESVTTPPPLQPERIVVQVAPKVIELPTNQAKLTAFPIPDNPKTPYEFEWQLESGPSKGTMENSHAQTLSLSDLEEGTYIFKLIVKGKTPLAYGEATGNVTVLPARRINTPPRAIVQPVNQTVNLPTTKAIIDGSASTDDNTDLKFHWEIVNGPVSYQKQLPAEPTLTLVDLVAGNYTITLTVTDSDGLIDTTQAHLTVNEEIDYPPKANAGEDIILYLPNNEVDLHGNMSSDDHGILEWEWTRASSPIGTKELAADTSNMRTPYPHISNLEEGVYTFTLKVIDSKGQSDEDQVNVYVKAPISQPPTADAGHSQQISLPRTWVTLDGTGSKDDVLVTSYLWSQVSGPNAAVIESLNASKTNVTGLTKGKYLFKLVVRDDLNNSAESTVEVVVNQDSNLPPVANAGPDFSITLPQSIVVVNGSGSHDDLKIVRFLWTRMPESLAAGKILGESFMEPALLLYDLVPGLYVFKLQVWDDQDKSNSDTVSFEVRQSVNHANILQALLNIELSHLTKNGLDSFCQSLALLLRSDGGAAVKVTNLKQQKDTGYAILQFMMEETFPNGTKGVVAGIDVMKIVEPKLKASQDIFDLKVLELDTLECQNPCSGHGKCQQATRVCICEPFWIENFVRRHLMDGKSNCDWSVIYVGIFLSVVVAGIICSATFVLCRKEKRPRPRKRYNRLEQNDKEKFEMSRHGHTSSLMTSESDSDDEELLFDDNLNRRPRSSPLSLVPKTVSNGTAKKNGYSKLFKEANA